MYVFDLHHIEHSIIVNHFRQYFDKRYWLLLWLIFALIILMVDFFAFYSIYLTLDRDNPGLGLIRFVRKLSFLLKWTLFLAGPHI